MRVDIEKIAKLPFFAGLDRIVLDRLLACASGRRFPPGKVLFEQGEKPEMLHVLLTGSVELYAPHQGRELGLLVMNAGDVFMPAAALKGEPYLNSARTLCASRLLLIESAAFREAAAAHPKLALRVARLLAAHFRLAAREILDIKARTAPQRLGSFLLELVDRTNTPTGVELPLSKSRLASRVGMSPETLSRSFQLLSSHGLTVRGRQVFVRDRERIERFCGQPSYATRDLASEIRAL